MTAVLLPNGKQQFIDINGKPLVGGTVGMYVPTTLISKNTWQDSAQTVLNTNPIVLDSRGQALIYGTGTYRQIVKDIDGNLIWDEPVNGNGGAPFPGGGVKTITHANSPYQMLPTDGVIFCNTSGGAIIINLVAANTYGGSLLVKIKGLATNLVTIVANGSDTINSYASFVLDFNNQGVIFNSDLVSFWGGFENPQAQAGETFLPLANYPSLSVADGVAAAANAYVYIGTNTTLNAPLTLACKGIKAGGGIITTGSNNFTVAQILGEEIPLFDKAGSGVITITQNTNSLLGWFSPTGDGTTDDTNSVTRWVNSSFIRKNPNGGNFVTDTVAITSSVTQESCVLGAGMGLTTFISKAGSDIFTIPGANIAGTYYFTYGEVGDFSIFGVGGSGYGVRATTAFNGNPCAGGYNNYIHDIVGSGLGGLVKDEVGLFSTIFSGLKGGGTNHVIDLFGGGPTSILENSYVTAVSPDKAGFRIHGNMTLSNCNGMNIPFTSGATWGIFGNCTSSLNITATTNGNITIPADSDNTQSSVVLRNCNIEAFPDVGIILRNCTISSDPLTIWQTASARANCIAVYIQDTIGSGAQSIIMNSPGPGSLVGGATWANNCPIWAPTATPYFSTIWGDQSSGGKTINVYDIADATTIVQSKIFGQNINSTLSGIGFDTLYMKNFIQGAGGIFGAFGATPITQPTVTGAKAGNVALANLLTKLAALGIIIDSTT